MADETKQTQVEQEKTNVNVSQDIFIDPQEAQKLLGVLQNLANGKPPRPDPNRGFDQTADDVNQITGSAAPVRSQTFLDVALSQYFRHVEGLHKLSEQHTQNAIATANLVHNNAATTAQNAMNNAVAVNNRLNNIGATDDNKTNAERDEDDDTKDIISDSTLLAFLRQLLTAAAAPAKTM